MGSLIAGWRERAARLKTELYAVYLSCKDPRTPWYVKALAACVLAYAMSPLDLIPDPIPILGYLDDLILIPLGLALVIKLLPEEVLAECRAQAQATGGWRGPTSWMGAAVIVCIWLITGLLLFRVLLDALAVSN